MNRAHLVRHEPFGVERLPVRGQLPSNPSRGIAHKQETVPTAISMAIQPIGIAGGLRLQSRRPVFECPGCDWDHFMCRKGPVVGFLDKKRNRAHNLAKRSLFRCGRARTLERLCSEIGQIQTGGLRCGVLRGELNHHIMCGLALQGVYSHPYHLSASEGGSHGIHFEAWLEQALHHSVRH
jgi:hypothetical protein